MTTTPPVPLPLLLQGLPASPYTRKMLALLRFRRLPYRFIIGMPGTRIPGHPHTATLPVAKVPLLPTFYLPDAAGELQAVTDSTPLIRRLEESFPERSVIPDDPVLALLNSLLEDYADEWLTRCMFHYRWYYSPDIDKAGTVLPLYAKPDIPPAMLNALKQQFSERQRARLSVVGSSKETAPVIEASYLRFLHLLDAHLQQQPYLLGTRPSSADFAIVGQLTALTHFDPTPMQLTLQHSPRSYAWVERCEDLCGTEVSADDWCTRDKLPDTLRGLLGEMARTHMPHMLANARAAARGEAEFSTEIDGQTWQQPTFGYQAKCLRWNREEFADLSRNDQTRARLLLDSVGLGPLIDSPLDS